MFYLCKFIISILPSYVYLCVLTYF
jgi:hypothetical protein